ncbi:hypothetical protein ACVIGB_007341 [Bradyrhizobium sp. USDA 4341]
MREQHDASKLHGVSELQRGWLKPASGLSFHRIGAVRIPRRAAASSAADDATRLSQRDADIHFIEEAIAGHQHSSRKHYRDAANSLRQTARERVQPKLFFIESGKAAFCCLQEMRRLLLCGGFGPTTNGEISSPEPLGSTRGPLRQGGSLHDRSIDDVQGVLAAILAEFTGYAVPIMTTR